MYDGNVQIGRTGLFLRAISTVDIALWDVKAKAAEMPLHKLLGGHSESVPSYASGGYYRDEKGHEALRGEMRRYLDEGHDIVKMKVGRLSAAEEVERVAAVRDEIGDERTLLLDANGVWGSSTEALRNCRAFEPYDPYFIEEPVMIDRVDTMAEVNDGIDYPVATGELEGTRHNFARLVDSGAATILQPDVTVCGGITEWLKIAHYASAYDADRAPLQLEHPRVAVRRHRERPLGGVLLPRHGREGVRRRRRRSGEAGQRRQYRATRPPRSRRPAR